MNKQPIGIFDSGIGGISIWKEILQLLPNENTIYLADSKNAPYGQKSKEEIIALCIKNTEFLIKQGCKIIVVACNTATTNAINILRETYNIPFIGIEPAIKPAALKTITNTIGILATKGTLNSSLFAETSSKYISNINVIEQIGEGLVPLIENGHTESVEMNLLLKKHLQPMLHKNIDCLVLGCTHYPFLIPQIKKITGPNVQIIDSGTAVAKQTKAILEKLNLLSSKNNANHVIHTNTQTEVLSEFISGVENTQLSYQDF
ncbi:glutamate racemase [Bacteroidota bacterium]